MPLKSLSFHDFRGLLHDGSEAPFVNFFRNLFELEGFRLSIKLPEESERFLLFFDRIFFNNPKEGFLLRYLGHAALPGSPSVLHRFFLGSSNIPSSLFPPSCDASPFSSDSSERREVSGLLPG